MNLKLRFWYTILLLLPFTAQGQNAFSKKTQKLAIEGKTICFDTLNILPSTLMLYTLSGEPIDTALYETKGIKACVYLSEGFPYADSVRISYSVFPYRLESPYFHRQIPSFNPDSLHHTFTYSSETFPLKTESLFGMNDLQKNGNISRGISIGNGQDMSVASNLNLQVAGQLSNDLEIRASISDQNVPIQPEGNTQQLQEFDKVFVQLRHQQGRLTAGDFVLQKPTSYFLNYRKKVQGAHVVVEPVLKDSTKRLSVYAGAALSKGKYAVNKLDVIEGNQGPYKLRGNNQESYIIVIAGSEKVYMDGTLLTRGQSNDYVIDYNTAEIVFTAHQIVTKDKRIRVEFEYTDRNYARSTLQTGVDFANKKLKIHAHYYDESDLKNQSLDQNLSDEEIQILSSAGDNLDAAISTSVDSVGYFNDRVLYKRIDSLGYNHVYVYSIHPDSAVYQLRFTNVGTGKGNYIQVKSSANGRVYQWVEPVGGIPQGSYEPITVLISPKRNQLLTVGIDYDLNKKTQIQSEFAFSNQDLNLFSNKDQADNQGLAFMFTLKNQQHLGKKRQWKLLSTGKIELEQANFTPIERYRAVEFNRNWNLGDVDDLCQQYSSLNIELNHAKYGSNTYRFAHFRYGSETAMQNLLQGKMKNPNWDTYYTLSMTQNGKPERTHSNFFRHNVRISRKLGKIKMGIEEAAEDNRYHHTATDSLSPNSYRFQEFNAFIQSADSNKVFFKLNAQQRKDHSGLTGSFKHATTADELKGELNLLKQKHQRLKAVATYRRLTIVDSLLSALRSDESSALRVEHNLSLWKGSVHASSFYEAGSGMEARKEFAYLEVAAGQGVYSWTDYNNNNVKELDEFEISAFPDEANYIRVYIQTNDYIKTYGNQFSSTLKLSPEKAWRKSDQSWKRIVSKFSNRTHLKFQHKSTDNSWNTILNPFVTDLQSPELMSLSSDIRNTTYFQRSHPVFGAELTYLQSQNKSLLSNGFELQAKESYKTYIRYNINKSLLLSFRGEKGNKSHTSEYFAKRNFDYQMHIAKPELSIQAGRKYRFRLHYQFSEKINASVLNEISTIHEAGGSFKLNQPGKGSWEVLAAYLQVSYNADDNTPIAYEMLNGHKAGDNYTWGLNYRRTLLNNMQFNINYTGRKAGTNPVIHVGSIMLRAFF